MNWVARALIGCNPSLSSNDAFAFLVNALCVNLRGTTWSCILCIFLRLSINLTYKSRTMYLNNTVLSNLQSDHWFKCNVIWILGKLSNDASLFYVRVLWKTVEKFEGTQNSGGPYFNSTVLFVTLQHLYELFYMPVLYQGHKINLKYVLYNIYVLPIYRTYTLTYRRSICKKVNLLIYVRTFLSAIITMLSNDQFRHRNSFVREREGLKQNRFISISFVFK